ncbi:MAG: proton-conducting transporter membrane subunit [Bacillota bacterium]|nr:proton-conducting transporter membrane subunit [Bacillota bacterium]
MSGVVNENTITSSLPLAIVLIPILGAAATTYVSRYSEKYRDYLMLAITALVFLLSAALFYYSWQEVVTFRVPIGLGDFSLQFRVDRLGSVFNLLSALIWFLASVFSISYMTHEGRRTRYYAFYLLTLGGCLGVFLTADLFSLFLFFELMSIASYLLVIHNQSEEALKAGRLYLFLGVAGGLSILTAAIMIYWFTGTMMLNPMLDSLIVLPARTLIAVLLIIGFGIKAGMVPLHIWLPKAHPVAPSPASALLSGIMIKTGAYGIIRVVTVLYTPVDGHGSSLWYYTESFGFILIWFGILTMFSAAFMALFQSNAKRILAYSSVSQMGYILMGIGACAYLAYEGPMAFGGFTLHIVNHAFFKAGMFMMVGAVYFRTGEIEINRLGGLWKDFPVTSVVFLLAAMGIAGIPGLNGYTSKVLLHHAIVEAFEHHHNYSLYWAEKIFMLTGAMTTCYIARLFSSIFLGRKPENLVARGKEPWNERAVFIIIGAVILFIGLNPFYVLKKLVGPLVGAFPFDEYSFNYLLKVNFWDIHDLQGMAVVIAMAAVIFILGNKFKLFTFRFPDWLSIEQSIYRPIVSGLMLIYTGCGRILETGVDSFYVNSPRLLTYYCIGGRLLEDAAEGLIVGSLGPLKKWSYAIGSLEKNGPFFRSLLSQVTMVLLFIYDTWLHLIRAFFHKSKEIVLSIFFFTFKMDYKPKGKLFMLVNTANFEYYLVIFFMVLIIIMSLQLFR